ncbi:MAG: hypothetical protein IJI84_03005 [Clostridia bacterium]|nr:hypothetical protein [Clostridia bacterium]
MKKFISSILVVLLIFITPASGINNSKQAEENSTSNSSIWKNPVFIYAFKAFIMPIVSGGIVLIVCKGIDKARGLENNATIDSIGKKFLDLEEKICDFFSSQQTNCTFTIYDTFLYKK